MFDPRLPRKSLRGCGCGTVVEVLVPGVQGPPGAKTAVTYEPQELTADQQAQVLKNLGLTSEQLAEKGFSLRFCTATLEASSKNNLLSLLTPQKNVREGDSVIDASRQLFQIVSVDKEAATFAVTAVLSKLGVTDYRELENLPTLGKLAALDAVGETELLKQIDLGSI